MSNTFRFVIILPTFLYGSSFFGVKTQEGSGIPTCNGKRPSLTVSELEDLATSNPIADRMWRPCDHLSYDGKFDKRCIYIYNI